MTKQNAALLSQKEVNQTIIRFFESEDAEGNTLYETWSEGQFPANCDNGDTDSFAECLSKIRETPFAEFDVNTQDGSVGLDEAVILYKSLCELTKENT